MTPRRTATLLLIFLSFSAFPADLLPRRVGLVGGFYNEPALKPGATLGLDWEWPLGRQWALGAVLPELTYFRFPHNLESYAVYPALSVRRIGPRGGYFALDAAAGLSYSRKIVPVYNLEGEKIDPPFTKQLILLARLSGGYDFSRRFPGSPWRLFASLGWKGLYPNNLRIQNQPMMQIGVNYRLAVRKRP